MHLLWLFAQLAVAGGLSKFVDGVIDNRIASPFWAWISGALLAVLGVYLLVTYPFLSAICVAIGLSYAINGNLDHTLFIGLALFAVCIVVIFRLFQPAMLVPATVFFAAATADEQMSNLAEHRKLPRSLNRLFSLQPILGISAVILTFLGHPAGYAIAIIGFDLGYGIVKYTIGKAAV